MTEVIDQQEHPRISIQLHDPADGLYALCYLLTLITLGIKLYAPQIQIPIHSI